VIDQYLKFEKQLYTKGIKYIAGVDEVGRGPLAGPFVVGAVILDLEKLIQLSTENSPDRNNDVSYRKYSDIRDSKVLTHRKRCELAEFILNEAISYSIHVLDSVTFDKIGVAKATSVSFQNAVNDLKVRPQHVLTDSFKIKDLSAELQTNINKGDSISITIAAASIIAKVHRDRLMDEYHEKYPQYAFNKNKGYGTAQHLKAIKEVGICPIHRTSYEPIKSIIRGLSDRGNV
jgi:ribonuclease HII